MNVETAHRTLCRGRVRAEIDLDAIAENVAALRVWIGPDTRLLVVVKANAYGHGAVPAARTALEAGAEWLGVACLEEGLELRRAGIIAPVLIQGYLTPADADLAVTHQLTPTVAAAEMALALAEAAERHHTVVPVHVKVDTGLNRYGLAGDEALQLIEQVAALPALRLEGLYTHFAVADVPDDPFTQHQYRVFIDLCRRAGRLGLDAGLLHAANSAATLGDRRLHLNLVRTGMTAYGLYPGPEVQRAVWLRPALSLKSEVARVFSIQAGDSVSYGRTFIAASPRRAALVPVGYADGYPRALSNRAAVLIGGRRAPILGRICMDQFVVDVTENGSVASGDEVVLIGRQGAEEITADELAELAGTISYEILCSLSARVGRIYRRRGEIVGIRGLTEGWDQQS